MQIAASVLLHNKTNPAASSSHQEYAVRVWPLTIPSLKYSAAAAPAQAKVSVLDSGFMLGDGVWEGLRLHQGVLLFIDDHLTRLYEGAKAIDMDIGCSKQQLLSMIYNTIDTNGMATASGVHIR